MNPGPWGVQVLGERELGGLVPFCVKGVVSASSCGAGMSDQGVSSCAPVITARPQSAGPFTSWQGWGCIWGISVSWVLT